MGQDSESTVSNEVMMERIEGKINLIVEAQRHQGSTIDEIRLTQNAQRDQINLLSGLNIQERLTSLSDKYEIVMKEIMTLQLAQASSNGERKGIEISAKALYSLLALTGVSFVYIFINYIAKGVV